jgi:hypothetical protein
MSNGATAGANIPIDRRQAVQGQAGTFKGMQMDFAAFRDTMVYAADLPGLIAYVATISLALFGVGLTVYADNLRDKRRVLARVRLIQAR